jgi:hypothetical protein
LVYRAINIIIFLLNSLFVLFLINSNLLWNRKYCKSGLSSTFFGLRTDGQHFSFKMKSFPL